MRVPSYSRDMLMADQERRESLHRNVRTAIGEVQLRNLSFVVSGFHAKAFRISTKKKGGVVLYSGNMNSLSIAGSRSVGYIIQF